MQTELGHQITVCLLTYNHAHLIESTLASIQQQTLSGYEIIVSDDCSTDDTWAILRRIATTDSRIRLIRTPRNLGMPGNANFAVAQSNRPYIALLHHDDLCRPDLLEKWVSVLERYPETGFVFNAYGVADSDFVRRETLPGDCINGRWLLEHYLFPRWGCLIWGTAMIRRSAWERVGGMRLQFGLLADIDLWMRLAMLGPVGYVDEPIQMLRHARPEAYPEEYKSGWSWPKQRYLYEIHAANRRAYYSLDTMEGRWHWWGFRVRLSLETAKWLTYAVVRRKRQMIATAGDSVTAHDLWFLKLYRRLLKAVIV
jgi:glycosyltransferase involved in cell wall biosynthesis